MVWRAVRSMKRFRSTGQFRSRGDVRSKERSYCEAFVLRGTTVQSFNVCVRKQSRMSDHKRGQFRIAPVQKPPARMRFYCSSVPRKVTRNFPEIFKGRFDGGLNI